MGKTCGFTAQPQNQATAVPEWLDTHFSPAVFQLWFSNKDFKYKKVAVYTVVFNLYVGFVWSVIILGNYHRKLLVSKAAKSLTTELVFGICLSPQAPSVVGFPRHYPKAD